MARLERKQENRQASHVLLLAVAAHAQEKVRITYASNSLAFLTAFVAKDQGFYARNGLNTELVQVRPAVAIGALVSGDADYAEELRSAIRSAARGAPMRAISITVRRPYFSFVADLQGQSVQELEGRTIVV